MAELAHRFVTTNGIRMHYVEAGKGPLVVLCHGFPESWYSWRHQIAALAEAGFRVPASDQPRYGQHERPPAARPHHLLHPRRRIFRLGKPAREAPAPIGRPP